MILHVDMDAFFAAVETLDDPSLRGKPLVVGGTVEDHGVVAAASYEAREFGVRSAMPTATALRLCPGCVRVPARHERYREVSREVRRILEHFTPAAEAVSIDEAYLDVAGSARLFGEAEEIARLIKRAIRDELGLTCSVGVASTRLVAKVASDFEKPDGLTVVPPGTEAEFLAPLPVEELPGIGPRAAETLHGMGVHTLGELARYPADALEERFGSYGPILSARARGEPPAGEEDGAPPGGRAPAKQVSSETTLREFTRDVDEIDRVLLGLAEEVASRARGSGVQGRTVTLKVRDDGFRTRTRSETLERPTDIGRELAQVARALYRKRPLPKGRRARLLGVALSKLSPAGAGQAELLVDRERERARLVDKVMDDIRSDMGGDAVTRGRLLPRPQRGAGRSPAYRPRRNGGTEDT